MLLAPPLALTLMASQFQGSLDLSEVDKPLRGHPDEWWQVMIVDVPQPPGRKN